MEPKQNISAGRSITLILRTPVASHPAGLKPRPDCGPQAPVLSGPDCFVRLISSLLLTHSLWTTCSGLPAVCKHSKAVPPQGLCTSPPFCWMCVCVPLSVHWGLCSVVAPQLGLPWDFSFSFFMAFTHAVQHLNVCLWCLFLPSKCELPKVMDFVNFARICMSPQAWVEHPSY